MDKEFYIEYIIKRPPEYLTDEECKSIVDSGWREEGKTKRESLAELKWINGTTHYKPVYGRTAREALAVFKEGNEYEKIVEIVEWVSNRVQRIHEIKNGEVLTT